MKSKSICKENVTLLNLITTKIKERDLSRSQLVQRMGYGNVSKTLRRLDHFTLTLEPPSREFVVQLLAILEINCLEFNAAVSATLDKMSRDAKSSFRPHIRVLLGTQIRPAIAWQIVQNLCCLRVSLELQQLSVIDEIDTVISLYLQHVENVLEKNLAKDAVGFEYHRKHDCFLQFNKELVLQETVFVQPGPVSKKPLGNRLANLLTAGGMR